MAGAKAAVHAIADAQGDLAVSLQVVWVVWGGWGRANQCAEENGLDADWAAPTIKARAGRRRERLRVVANEPIGPYALIRVERGGLDLGIPGQFFMLEAPGRPLPRPMSLCQAPAGELAFRLEAVGPGTRALATTRAGRRAPRLRPARQRLPPRRREAACSGGGIGIAPFPYLSERLGGPPAILGFRSDWHAEAAALVPNAEFVVEPTLVTEPLADLVTLCYKSSRAAPSRCSTPSATCCPVHSSHGRRRWPAATGRLRMLRGDRRAFSSASASPVRCWRRRRDPNASGCLDALEAPEVARALDAFVSKTVTPLPRDGNRPVGSPRPTPACSTRSASRTPGIEGLLADVLPLLPSSACRSGSLSAGRRVRVRRVSPRSTTEPRWRRSSSTCRARTSRRRPRRRRDRRAARARTSTPLYAKLSPAVTDLRRDGARRRGRGGRRALAREHVRRPRPRRAEPRAAVGAVLGGCSGPARSRSPSPPCTSATAPRAFRSSAWGAPRRDATRSSSSLRERPQWPSGTVLFSDPEAPGRVRRELAEELTARGLSQPP